MLKQGVELLVQLQLHFLVLFVSTKFGKLKFSLVNSGTCILPRLLFGESY